MLIWFNRQPRFLVFKIELRPGETIKKLMDKSQDIARELEAFGEIFIDNVKGAQDMSVWMICHSKGCWSNIRAFRKHSFARQR